MQGHRDILPLGLLPLELQVLNGFRSFYRMKEFGDGFDGELFYAYSSRGGNYNCFLSHIARWLPIANNLQEFFVHAVLFPDS